MKLLFYCFVFLTVSFAALVPARAQTERFPVGEKLTYHISFASFADAGFIELHTVARERINERDQIHLRARLKTTGFVEATLLSLDSEYNSVIAADSGLPLRIERTLRESNAPTDVKREFTENQTSSSNSIHDLVSAIYQIRTLPLALNSSFPLRVAENNQIYEADLRVVKKTTVSTAVGAFGAFVVQVQLPNNDKYNRYRIQIIISDDERRLPISFLVKHEKGEIRAELASVQILPPEIPTPAIAITVPNPVPTPFPSPLTPPQPPQIRPTPAPKPYVENQPLAAELPFALKEKLTYDVFRQNRKIAQIQFEIVDRKLYFSRDAVNLTARIVQSSDPLLAPGTSFTSYVSPESLTPHRSEMRIGGALSRFADVYNFDQNLGSVTTDKGKVVQTPVGTYDLLSLAYGLRSFRFYENPRVDERLKPNQQRSSNVKRFTKAAIYIGSSHKVVVFDFVKKEPLDFPGRKVNALLLNITLGDPQVDALGLKLWLSDDSRRIPLRFAFSSPLGEIRAELNTAPVP